MKAHPSGHATAEPQYFCADCGGPQAKETGGMVALFPRQVDAEQMAIPGGEPPEDLHCTLVFLGDDVSTLNGADLGSAVAKLADITTVITARVFGHANFNPTDNACAVYIVNDADAPEGAWTDQSEFSELTLVHDQAVSLAGQLVRIPEQYRPWVPHLTASYYASADDLQFTGIIQFDRLGLAWMGEVAYYPFAGA